MALEPGTVLGSYEVTAKIGEGGMGEVYRATDTSLDRQVAIKVLPDSFASDTDRLARFEREAKVLASLNHPNIGAIYGLEKSGATRALVLELIEGPTLADRISQGPIPVGEALPIAKQIAEALEAAHEAGVIHRDLKPANIKVRDDGTVKVLDFGLAKSLDTAPGGDPSQSPTLTAAATQMGVIIGTAAYMSPEQARGKAVDRRTDIWAFGAVLFEMLTGRRIFDGEDVTQTLARVVESEPDLTAVPRGTPRGIRRLIARCLVKDPKTRLRDIGEARLEIDHVGEDGEAEPGTPSPRRLSGGLVAAALIAGMVIGGGAIWMRNPDVGALDSRPIRFDLAPGGALPVDSINGGIAVSPDGRTLVYTARVAGSGRASQLFRHDLETGEAVPLPTTERARWPIFSPAGTSVAFFSGPALSRVALDGGAPVVLAQVDPRTSGASWTTDGAILFGAEDGIVRVPETGGTPEIVIPAEDGTTLQSPSLLPDNEHVLFVTRPVGLWAGASEVVVQSLATGRRHVLVGGAVDPRYVSTGHLVYVRVDDNAIVAAPFDIETLSVDGEGVEFEMVRRVELSAHGGGDFDIGPDGTLAYSRPDDGVTSRLEDRTIVWIDADGREEPLPIQPDTYVRMDFSPDGNRLALDTGLAEGAEDIWIADVLTGLRTRLTFDEAEDWYPLWTPDGERIVFSSFRDGGGLFSKAADGTGTVERLVAMTADRPLATGVSPDGQHVVFVAGGFAGEWDIFRAPLKADGSPEPLIQTDNDERRATVSPNGRWMAYQSDSVGQMEIFVVPYPDVSSGQWQVTYDGGWSPAWMPDSSALIYRSGQALRRVDLSFDPTVSAVASHTLYEGDRLRPVGDVRSHDVAPDGRVAVLLGEQRTLRRINVVLNWLDELKRRAPVD